MVNQLNSEKLVTPIQSEIKLVNESNDGISIEIAQSNTDLLNKKLNDKVFSIFWGNRMIRGIYESGGNCKKTALLITVCFGIYIFGGMVYTLGRGVREIFKFTSTEIASGKSIPSIIGHTGEWLGEIILDTYVCFSELRRLIRESDFAEIKKIYKQVIQQQEKWNLSELYQHVLQNFQYLGSQCLSPKNLFDQRVQAIQIMKTENTKNRPCKTLDLDRKLVKIYKRINKDLQKELGFKNYRTRLSKGYHVIGRNHGKSSQASSIFIACFISIAILALSLFPLIGIGYIGRDVKQGDVTIIGHMGEWLAAGIGFIFMARYLNKNYLLRHGDLEIARSVILRHINKYEDHKKLYKRLISVGNDQLDYYAQDCGFTTLPSTYRLR